MKLLSIDIGIKNLAFCLFNINSKDQFCIEKWDTINLCNNQKTTCQACLKSKKKCSKKALFYRENAYYCKLHAKKQEWKIPSKEKKNLKKLKLIQLKNIYNKLDLPPEKKMTKKKYLEKIEEEMEASFFKFVKNANANKMSMTELGRQLKNKMIHIPELTHVIVENQVGPLAIRMKTLQGMVMQHFIEKNIETIEEISATNKLKEYSTKKTNYQERKKLSKQITLELISNTNYFNSWKEHFLSHKKKDDLADSFLQGIWYLKNNDYIASYLKL